MVIGVGIDIIDVARFRAGLNEAMVASRFSQDEAAYCRSRGRPWECFAARLAAKRAFARALAARCGPPATSSEARGLDARPDVEVVRSEGGDVELRLSGEARDLALEAGAARWVVSLSHTRNTALAVVVLESTDDGDDDRRSPENSHETGKGCS